MAQHFGVRKQKCNRYMGYSQASLRGSKSANWNLLREGGKRCNATVDWDPDGNWPCSILENFFIYLHEYILPLIYSDKVNAGHFHSTKRFTDDLCLIKDGGKFGRSFPQIYSSELELKIKTTMLLFFNLEITIKEGTFTYNVFDKKDTF